MAATHPAVAPAIAVTSPPPGRRRRAAAFASDLAAGLAALLVACLVAAAWLLARSAWGRDDPADGDTALAFALIGAVPPAWLAWLALHLARDAATPGEGAAGLRVEGARNGRRRLLRLAVHPLGASGWVWVALLLWVAGASSLALAPAIVAAAVAAGGIVSAAMLAVRPGARPLHDRLAGTRLVRR